MIRILSFLCLATSAFGLFSNEKNMKFTKNLRVRFDINPFANALNTAFIDQPLTKTAAEKKKWVEVTGPGSHEEFSSLVLLCPKDSYNFCLFFDDTGYIAGAQIAVEDSQFTESKYDWKNQGFYSWTVDTNGASEDYWTTAIYFSSPEYLQTSADTRIASRDATKLLQDKYLYVSGFNGQLLAIPTDVTELANTTISGFTEQACMLWMGHHYYYNMTADLPCEENSLFTYFPLVYNNQVIGIGAMVVGKYTVKKGFTTYNEVPDTAAVKMIVPRGPQCLYDLASTPGIVTWHMYFIDQPTNILCL